MRSRVSLLIGDRRRKVVALVLTSTASGFVEAGALALVAEIAANLVTGAKRIPVHLGPIQTHAPIGTLIIVALALSVIRLGLQVPLSVLPSRIAADVQAKVRAELFHNFTRASWEVQSSDREGQLQETMTLQALQATQGAVQATQLITSMITFIVLLISAVALSPLAAAVVLVASTLMFQLLRPLRVIGVNNARSLSKAQVMYARAVAEAIRTAEDTQVFGVAAAQRSRVDALIETARTLYFRTQTLAKLIANLYQSLIYLMVVGALAGLYLAGATHVGSLGAVVLLLMRAGQNGQQVQTCYQGLSQALPFVERIQEATRRYAESSPEEGQRPLAKVETVAFEDVSFAYRPGRPVLSDISFEMAGSEAVGIIGPSGAGKSTMIQILLQLRKPNSGRYLVNGISAPEYARADWHRLVAYVPQEPRLLHASVADNIRYFRPLDDESVERAARLARIHDDIIGWSNGYDTVVGPRADAVSGGQQQRICLARALAARPEVLVLDEPTSALDPHSETLIQESLSTLKHDLTLFIIAHRMSTLDICDRVMVIVDGRLVAFDTKALLQTQNHYYRSASMIAAGTAERTFP